MGSQGMARRGRRHLPKVRDGMSEGDRGRLFGQFRWGAYSPAGSVERGGFFWRQVRRQRRQRRGAAHRAIAYALLASSLAVLALVAVGVVVLIVRLAS
jgi:hypothetical protein